MIEVQQLTKRYGDTLAVDQLSFRVEPGRVTGFLGPNGAGKSTTLRAVLGLDRPTAGRALIDGRPYQDWHFPLRKAGAVLEAAALHPGRTARAHLRGLARSNRIPAERVDDVLRQVGLEAAANGRAKAYSLGMAQRLGIAAALLGDPEVLLFDEPLNGLDPEGIRWIRDLLRRLAAAGRTVFVSSHLMTEMAQTADHLIVIGRGRLLADEPTADFIARNSRSYVAVRTPEPERLLDLLARSGIPAATGPDGTIEAATPSAEDVGRIAAAGRLPVYEITPRTASLEEAFMQLTEDKVQHRGFQEVYR
ncbi:ABC transporter ATP-binding protein [Streptomyces boninensis]|uniref:ABC transporter ATP-binding protein n=1 Tax=Streptomyces boninensis TaxID=2039455 RepID=UPI003B20E400